MHNKKCGVQQGKFFVNWSNNICVCVLTLCVCVCVCVCQTGQYMVIKSIGGLDEFPVSSVCNKLFILHHIY
jgi:hypothetical protein